MNKLFVENIGNIVMLIILFVGLCVVDNRKAVDSVVITDGFTFTDTKGDTLIVYKNDRIIFFNSFTILNTSKNE